jgi:peptidyl-prolyl cis-trans isomerase C
MRLRRFIAATLAVTMLSALGACNEPAKPKKNDEKASSETPKASTNGDKAEKPAYNPDKPTLYATGAVATIKGEPVTAERYNEEVDRLTKAVKVIKPGAAQNYKKMLLDRVVNEAIMERRVAEHKIEVSDAEYEEAWKEASARYGGPEAFEKMIEMRVKDGGPSIDEVKKDIRRTAGYKKAVAKEFPFDVSEADAKKFYDENAARFQQPEQVKASHVLFKLERSATPEQVKEAEEKAKDISAKARKKGADFAALAREHSQGPTAPKGGDLGFFPKNKMVKPFADAAFALKDGEISDPVRSPFGFHVIKRTGSKPPEQIPFDQVKDRLMKDLAGQKERESLKKFIEKAEKEYKVERKEDAIVVNIDPKAAATPPPGMFHPPGAGHGPNDGHGHGAHDGHGHGGAKKGLPPGALKLNGKQPPSVNPKKVKVVDPKKPAPGK